MAATILSRNPEQEMKTMFRGTCPACGKDYKAGTVLVQADIQYTAYRRLEYVHAVCPTEKHAAAVGQPAESQGPKRAKFSSWCPGCGALIEEGAPLFYDYGLRKYVSDCCV